MYYVIAAREEFPANAINSIDLFDYAAVSRRPLLLALGVPLPDGCYLKVSGREIVAIGAFADEDEACHEMDMLFSSRSERIAPEDRQIPYHPQDEMIAARRALPPIKLSAAHTASYVRNAAEGLDLAGLSDVQLTQIENGIHAEAEHDGLDLDIKAFTETLGNLRHQHTWKA
ncbi:hypothetical protein [Tropicimonas sp. IMCC34011]|uniref:hypothetical protein n=1 Tax=Tropicimonas sp. IMCC34011 TaxID=2248759 RepID=UPI000E25D4F8|nr:hypothetical protein [Tropicimonas sp. IMCC34011]